MCVFAGLVITACVSTSKRGKITDDYPLVTGHASSADGLDIVYDVRGHGDPPLVFIHGAWCDRRHFGVQMDVFSLTHQVVCIDLGGHGESEKTRKDWTLASFAEDVRAVVEKLGLRDVILVGHSMGGPVSLLAAARMPDRMRAVVGVEALHDAEIVYTPEKLSPLIESLSKDFAGTVDAVVGSGFPRGSNPALVGFVKQGALKTAPEVAAGVIRAFLDYDARAAFRDCPVPIRVINTLHSAKTEVLRNKTYARSYDAVILDGFGHFPMLEDSTVFDARLREVLAGL